LLDSHDSNINLQLDRRKSSHRPQETWRNGTRNDKLQPIICVLQSTLTSSSWSSSFICSK